MNSKARSILTGIANLVALFVVIGVVSHSFYQSADKPTAVTNAEPMLEIPVAKSMGQSRDLRSKGKGKGKGDDVVDCIPLDATPAPTKGKGKGSKGKGGKGKGSSEAPVSCGVPTR